VDLDVPVCKPVPAVPERSDLRSLWDDHGGIDGDRGELSLVREA
jgi:hypothetical protein